MPDIDDIDDMLLKLSFEVNRINNELELLKKNNYNCRELIEFIEEDLKTINKAVERISKVEYDLTNIVVSEFKKRGL